MKFDFVPELWVSALLVLLVIGASILVTRKRSARRSLDIAKAATDTALALLDARLRRGEISPEEYEAAKRDLDI